MHRIDPTFRDAWERIKVRRAKAKRNLAEAIAAEEAEPTRFALHVRVIRWEGTDRGLMQAMDAMLEVEPTLYWDKTLPEVEPLPDPPPATWVTPVPLPKPVTREELATRLHAAAEEGVNELLDAIAPVPGQFGADVLNSVAPAPSDDQIWGMALMEGRGT